ncbi:MAG TPA: hypothetical protein VJQ56_06545 [Blastocatellia bacterium]|nr:hypothetical protein [Blastocatellia bacterium]
MGLRTDLDNALGKSIDDICPNNFHNHASNHCAHFVSHVLDLDFSFNCREFQGGGQPGANIRVHEIFSRCPLVGKFEDRPADREVLVFVTRHDIVDIANKEMQNIPQKHIGILVDGNIYHYSNTQDKVVKIAPAAFLSQFDAIYAGSQALFYGTVPGSDIILNIDTTGASVAQGIGFELKREADTRWFARAVNATDSNRFYVGRETKNDAKQYYGIYQKTNEYYGPKFNHADYTATLDHWAYLLYATGYCESKNFFNVFNTYDRAKFTYGFYQLAAHTPNDNLILLFRRLVGLNLAKQYFPELTLIDGKLHRINEDGGSTDLETVTQTGPNNANQLQLFMNYLNPNRKPIEEQEVLQVARLMHWTVNDPAIRELQVRVAGEILQNKMSRRYSQWYPLHGKSDTICALVADIHHQGRASRVKVKNALNAANPENALLKVNPNYASREADLRDVVNELKAAGKLGQKKYDAATNEFI